MIIIISELISFFDRFTVFNLPGKKRNSLKKKKKNAWVKREEGARGEVGREREDENIKLYFIEGEGKDGGRVKENETFLF